MKELIWLIPLVPFLGAFLNGVVLRHRISKSVAGWLAVAMVGTSCLLSIGAVASYMGSPEHEHHEGFEVVLYNWIPAGMLEMVGLEGSMIADFNVSMGFLLDPLSSVMLLFVTFVGTLIHIYSIGYMAHEDGVQRFFTYLNLFMGAMLTLILGNNYLVTFVGWEGVGLCSYLLIGFYYKEEFPPYAGRKAFIVNRVGDFGFVIGLLALVTYFGTLNYTDLFPRVIENIELAESSFLGPVTLMGFITFCLFVGACGKSAQIPLFVWLPDAMAGPTPVSALIHAATMVTAGVYMVARSNALFQIATRNASMLVAVVGCATALMAATIGLAQTDIKKVLAYSTVSQLGYMFLACGVGSLRGGDLPRLITHAFFKALLFLGSGSVIHAMSGEQDMRQMGGLKEVARGRTGPSSIGTVAIAGIPPFSPVSSRRTRSWPPLSYEHQYLALDRGDCSAAGLTALYMFRLVYLTDLFGEFRGTDEQRAHLHESPTVDDGAAGECSPWAASSPAGSVFPKGMTFGAVDIGPVRATSSSRSFAVADHMRDRGLRHGRWASRAGAGVALIIIAVGVALTAHPCGAAAYYGGPTAASHAAAAGQGVPRHPPGAGQQVLRRRDLRQDRCRAAPGTDCAGSDASTPTFVDGAGQWRRRRTGHRRCGAPLSASRDKYVVDGAGQSRGLDPGQSVLPPVPQGADGSRMQNYASGDDRRPSVCSH